MAAWKGVGPGPLGWVDTFTKTRSEMREAPVGEVRKVQDRLPASGLPSGPPTPPAVAVVLVERDDSSEIDGGSAVAAFATGFEGLLRRVPLSTAFRRWRVGPFSSQPGSYL